MTIQLKAQHLSHFTHISQGLPNPLHIVTWSQHSLSMDRAKWHTSSKGALNHPSRSTGQSVCKHESLSTVLRTPKPG